MAGKKFAYVEKKQYLCSVIKKNMTDRQVKILIISGIVIFAVIALLFVLAPYIFTWILMQSI